MSEKNAVKRPRWYIIQTSSKKENVVKKDLERRIQSMGMQDYIFNVIVPEETIIEKKADGTDKEKVVQIYPGYIFVEMIETDESWFIVRNTPGVTGLLGSSGGGTKPVPLLDSEINQILMQMGMISKPDYGKLLGKTVSIIEGPYSGINGVVSYVDEDQEIVKVEIQFLGTTVPAEMSVHNVKEVLE